MNERRVIRCAIVPTDYSLLVVCALKLVTKKLTWTFPRSLSLPTTFKEASSKSRPSPKDHHKLVVDGTRSSASYDPANWSLTASTTALASWSVSSCALGVSAYTRTTSSVPEGRTKAREVDGNLEMISSMRSWRPAGAETLSSERKGGEGKLNESRCHLTVNAVSR